MIEKFADGDTYESIRDKINDGIDQINDIPNKFVSYGGKFATVALANAAIKNEISLTTGINKRDGTRVDIGTDGNYVEYRWKGGYADGNLVKSVDLDNTIKITSIYMPITVELPLTPFVSSKGIDFGGQIITGTFGLTDYYSVQPGSILSLSKISGTNYVNYVGFYDLSKIKISRVGEGIVTTSPSTYTVPDAAKYFVLYQGTDSGTNFKVSVNYTPPVITPQTNIDYLSTPDGLKSVNIKQIVENSTLALQNANSALTKAGEASTPGDITASLIPFLKAKLSTQPITVELPLTPFVTSKTLDASGQIIAGTFGLTDYYSVKPGSVITLTKISGTNFVDYVGFYDASNVKISRQGIGITTSTTPFLHTVPDNANKFVLYQGTDSGTNFKVSINYTPPSISNIPQTNIDYLSTPDGLYTLNVKSLLSSLTPIPIKGKIISILGDSISLETGATNTLATVWWGRLVNWFNLTYRVDAISGSRIGFNNNSSAPERISATDPVRWQNLAVGGVAPNVIFIFMGTNDFDIASPAVRTPLGTYTDARPTTVVDGTTFYACLKYLYFNLTTLYKTSKIIHMTPIARGDKGETIVNSAGSRLVDYVNAIKLIAQDYGVEVINTFSESGLTYVNTNNTTAPRYTVDQLHPGPTGQLPIAQCVAAKIQNYLRD